LKSPLKSFLVNISISIGSILIFMLAMELVFPHLLHKVPLSVYVGLDDGYKVLGQSTKKSVVPEDYIAIVGDSHALGTGDWFKQAVRKHKFTQGDYHSAHVLYYRIGRDIISYGALGSGSLRNHRSDVQRKILEIMGYSKEEAESRFGFLLNALDAGAPPHGGFAFGYDRWVMIAAQLHSLRDVIAFPKTQRGQDLLMDAPTPVEASQLDDLGIRLAPSGKNDGTGTKDA